MRSISRVVDVSFNTIAKLLEDAGEVCASFHADNVRNVKAKRVQCDEIWSFCYAKKKNVSHAKRAPYGAGDVWTWTGIEAETKLIVSWMVGSRDAETAELFMDDLQDRLANRVQLTTDGHSAYLDAVAGAFGGAVDYAMLVKLYGEPEPGKAAERRYSPSPFIRALKRPISGEPDPAHISTSYTERQNLTMRMQMRRFTRLTNAFSKKFDNHCHALALYFVWYNWVRIHKTLRMTPAMAAGLTDKLMDMMDIANMIEAAAPKPKRGPYGTKAERTERDQLAADIEGIKAIIQDEWNLPILPSGMAAFAEELRERVRAGEDREPLYLRAGMVQVHDLGLALTPARLSLVNRVYALLGKENSN